MGIRSKAKEHLGEFVDELRQIDVQAPKIIRRPGSRTDPAFDGKFLSRTDVMRQIQDAAAQRGRDLNEDQIGALYADVLARNREALAAGRDVPEIVDIEDNPVQSVIDPITAIPAEMANVGTMGLTRQLGGPFSDPSAGDPFTALGQAIGGLRGIMTGAGPIQSGLARGFGATAPGVSAGGGLLRNVGAGLAAGGAFGGGSAAIEGAFGDGVDAGDVSKAALHEGALFGGLTAMSGGIPYVAGKISPQVGMLAEAMMSSRPGRAAFDFPVFYGLDRMSVKDGDPGSEWYMRFARSLGGTIGAQAGGGKRPTPKDLREAIVRAEKLHGERAVAEAALKASREVAAAEAAAIEAGKGDAAPIGDPLSTEPAPTIKVDGKLRKYKGNRRQVPAIESDPAAAREILGVEPGDSPLAPEAARLSPTDIAIREARAQRAAEEAAAAEAERVASVEAVVGAERDYGLKTGEVPPTVEQAVPPARPDVKAEVKALKPGESPPAPEAEPGVAPAAKVMRPFAVGGEAAMDFPADRPASRKDMSPPQSGDMYLGAGLGGAQSAYDAVASRIKARAERRAADLAHKRSQAVGGEMSPDELRASSPHWLEFGEVLNSIERGEMSPREAAEWMLKNSGKLPGAVTPAGLARAKEELISEGVKSPSEKNIKRRAMANSTLPEVQASLESGLNRVDAVIAQFVDPLTSVQTMERNQQSGPLVESSVRAGHSAERAQIVMAREYVKQVRDILDNPLGSGEAGIERGSKDATIVFDVLDGNVEAIRNADNPAAVQAAAERLEPVLRDMWETRDMIERAYGGKGVGRIEKYAPHGERRYRLKENPGGWLSQLLRPRESGSEVPGAPTKVLSNRERNRSGKLKPEQIEKDIWNVMDSYIVDQASRVARTPVIASTEASFRFMQKLRDAKIADAREARKAGDTEGADALVADAKAIDATSVAFRRLMQSSYNGIPFGLNKAMTDVMFKAIPGTRVAPGAPVYYGSKWMKQRFNEARYVAAFPFVALRMWTSVGLLGSYPGQASAGMVEGFVKNIPQWNAQTMTEMFTPKAQALVDATHFGWRKQQQMGGMSSEGSTGMAAQGDRLIRPGRYQRIMNVASRPTNAMENMTSRYAVLMADKIGRYMGLEGRELEMFRNDLIIKTQSAYNSEAMEEIRKSPTFNLAFPAQSFSLTAGRNLLESAIPGFGVDYHGQVEARGGPDRITAGARGAAGAIAGMYLTNMLYEWANTYRDVTDPEQLGAFSDEAMINTLQSFVPWSTAITGAGPGKGQMYPAALFQDLFGGPNKHKGIKQLVGEGKYERAAAIFAKHFMPAGGQINRAMTADFMIDRGIIAEEDRALAITVGWWATPRGKQYLRQLSGLAPQIPAAPPAPDTGLNMGMDMGMDMGMKMGGQ